MGKKYHQMTLWSLGQVIERLRGPLSFIIAGAERTLNSCACWALLVAGLSLGQSTEETKGRHGRHRDIKNRRDTMFDVGFSVKKLPSQGQHGVQSRGGPCVLKDCLDCCGLQVEPPPTPFPHLDQGNGWD